MATQHAFGNHYRPARFHSLLHIPDHGQKYEAICTRGSHNNSLNMLFSLNVCRETLPKEYQYLDKVEMGKERRGVSQTKIWSCLFDHYLSRI